MIRGSGFSVLGVQYRSGFTFRDEDVVCNVPGRRWRLPAVPAAAIVRDLVLPTPTFAYAAVFEDAHTGTCREYLLEEREFLLAIPADNQEIRIRRVAQDQCPRVAENSAREMTLDVHESGGLI